MQEPKHKVELKDFMALVANFPIGAAACMVPALGYWIYTAIMDEIYILRASYVEEAVEEGNIDLARRRFDNFVAKEWLPQRYVHNLQYLLDQEVRIAPLQGAIESGDRQNATYLLENMQDTLDARVYRDYQMQIEAINPTQPYNIQVRGTHHPL